MKARREEVVANLKRLKEECLPLLTVLEDQEKVKQLRTDKQFTFPILAEQYQARPRPAGRGAAHPDRWPPWLALLQRAGAAHTTQAPPLRHGRRRAMRLGRHAPHRTVRAGDAEERPVAVRLCEVPVRVRQLRQVRRVNGAPMST